MARRIGTRVTVGYGTKLGQEGSLFRFERSLLVLALSLLAAVFAFAHPAFAACDGTDLLLKRAVASSRGVDDPANLTDGRLSYEGDTPASTFATRLKGLRPYAEWDLGSAVHISAAAVQADNNDVYRLSVSSDGKSYTPLWTLDPVSDPGLRERTTRNLDAAARYVRFEALSGDGVYAASEVRVYCGNPEPWPPSRVVRASPPTATKSTRLAQTQSLKIAFGLSALTVLFVFVPMLGARARRVALALLVVTSALSWTQFGAFQGSGTVHYWDMFHYFVGTKYFPELGYFDLYECAAQAERENGRGAEVDSQQIRDLEDNRLYPGDWTKTPDGACRARFTSARWRSFKSDLAAFRAIFVWHSLPEAFADHGFNGTPPTVVWLRLFTSGTRPTATRLALLGQLDALALAGTVAFLWWGFGEIAGVAACLFLALGFHWSYLWVGGCLGRDTWLVCDAAGFALLARKRFFAGGAALTLAGLLRLFPFMFVFGAVVWALVTMWRHGWSNGPARKLLVGAGATLLVGTAGAGAVVGFHSYRDFAHVIERHSSTPLANQIGLSTLLAWRAGNMSTDLEDGRLTDPFERWESAQLRHRVEERPLWALAMTASVAVIVLAAWQGASAAVCAALAGLVLFSALPMTSYDYSWVVMLVALSRLRPRLPFLLVAFALFTQIAFVFGGDATLEGQHLFASLACGALLLYAVPMRAILERRGLAEGASAH